MENQVHASNKLAEGQDRFSKANGGAAGEVAGLVKDFGTHNLQTARQALAHAQEVLTDGAKQYASATDGYVRANPWTVLGGAAAAGLLIGMLLSRR